MLMRISLAAAFLALVSLPVFAASRVADRPNVVVIFVDDMAYADIGPFGATPYATPNLDRMAREGRRFTNFHVSQPVCSASRASLLTGSYSNRLGIHGALGPNATHGLDPAELTLPRMFKEQGYATGMAGKWHLGHHRAFLPLRHGFDEYLGIPYSNDMWPHHPEAKPGTYPPLPLFEGDEIVDADVSPEEQAEFTKRFTERAVAFIDRHHERPFYFYLAHPQPHVPLFASDAFVGASGAGLYGDVIQEIDWSVGQIVAALERNGIAENTLVIFTSDNGPWLSYGDHAGSSGQFREGKGTAWEGGTRVPCLMRWPAKLPAGTTSDAMLMTIDLLPTLAGLIGAPPPALPIDGRDVWPLLRGEPGAVNPHPAYFTWYNQNELQTVTSGDGLWKLVLPHRYRTLAGRPGGTGGIPVKYTQQSLEHPALYNLRDDPGETNDVSRLYPSVRDTLLAHAEAARRELGDKLTDATGRGNRPPGRIIP
jgi:arylsulfatase